MDLDDELLALAGGDDSSDDEVAPAVSKHSPPRSPVRETNEASDDEDVAPQSKKVSARARGRKLSVDDEDARGHADSSPSRNSLHSASMSESDSEGGSIDGDDGSKPPFPYGKYFYSAKEKEEIMALPEIQREETLSERAQVYERHLQDIALRRLLATREREEAAKKKKKRKGSSDPEDSPRKSTRQKMTVGGRKVGEVSNAIEAYKKQREQKEKRDKARKREIPGKRKSHSDDEAHSDSSRDASDVDWDDTRRRSITPPKDDPPADLHDLNRARIGRSGFAQLCFYPGFDEAICHCFVRLAIGFNKSLGRNEYRMAEIKRFVESKPYAMEGLNKRNFITTQYAVLAHGKSERQFPFIACSDGPFTEGEFNRWRQTMVVDDCRMPTKSQIAEKVTDINSLINHTFTQEELAEKLRRQGAASTKQIAYERIQLERKREAAVASNNEALIAECDEKLRNLVGPNKLAFGTSLNKNAASKAAKDNADRLEEVNMRNARLNAENVRRAQIEERRQQKLLAAKAQRAEAEADRLNKSKMQTQVPKDSDSGETRSQSTGLDGIPSNSQHQASTPSNSQVASAKNGVPTIRHRPTDDDNIAALDFDLDIEI